MKRRAALHNWDGLEILTRFEAWANRGFLVGWGLEDGERLGGAACGEGKRNWWEGTWRLLGTGFKSKLCVQINRDCRTAAAFSH